MNIHPSSVVSPKAEIDHDVIIGPFCVIHPFVKIGSGTVLQSHVVIGCENGRVTIGKNNKFSPGVVAGGPPQDLKYKAEPTELIIGSNNDIRECCTLNIGTTTGGGITRIGDHNLFMAYVHIAHDCKLDDHIVIANSTHFGGHCLVEKHAKIGGVCCFNQFTRVGEYSFIAGDSTVNKDILPYSIAQGNYAVARGTNKIGLERAGFSLEEINQIHRALRILIKGSETLENSLERIKNECLSSQSVKHIIDFISKSDRGIAK